MLLAAAGAAGAEVLDLGIARDVEGHLEGCLDKALDAGVDVLVTSGTSRHSPILPISISFACLLLADTELMVRVQVLRTAQAPSTSAAYPLGSNQQQIACVQSVRPCSFLCQL